MTSLTQADTSLPLSPELREPGQVEDEGAYLAALYGDHTQGLPKPLYLEVRRNHKLSPSCELTGAQSSILPYSRQRLDMAEGRVPPGQPR